MSFMAIWRDNGTLTYWMAHGSDDFPDEDDCTFTLSYQDGGPTLAIFGDTAEAVAQTAAYFMSLEKSTDQSSRLVIKGCHEFFEFYSAGERCLTRMLVASPSRPIEFHDVKLSVAQTQALATSLYPVHLTFNLCIFEDQGTAFVTALEKRKSPIGSLAFKECDPFDFLNLKRLIKLEHKIEELALPDLHYEADEAETETEAEKDIMLCTFAAKVIRLHCEIWTPLLSDIDWGALHINAEKLSLTLHDGVREPFPTEPVLCLLQRLAQLGHFVELKLSFAFNDYRMRLHDEDLFRTALANKRIPISVAGELIRTALANSNLQVLDLGNLREKPWWDQHVETLLDGLKDHTELLTLKLEVGNDAFGLDFCYLRRLLSRNRKIKVTNEKGVIYSDGSSIHELYSLNRFYRGSESLAAKPFSYRLAVGAAAMVECARNKFQRYALLCSNHTDVLYDLIQFAQEDELYDGGDSLHRTQDANLERNRKRCRS